MWRRLPLKIQSFAIATVAIVIVVRRHETPLLVIFGFVFIDSFTVIGIVVRSPLSLWIVVAVALVSFSILVISISILTVRRWREMMMNYIRGHFPWVSR